MVLASERFKSYETNYRKEAIKLWETLLTQSPPSATPLKAGKFPKDFKSWIRDYYCPARKDRSILKTILPISFEKEAQSVASQSDPNAMCLIRQKRLLYE